MKKTKIDIIGVYKYDDVEEKIDLLDIEFTLNDNEYVNENMKIRIFEDGLEVIKFGEISYKKSYFLGKFKEAILEFNNNKIISQIKVDNFKKENNTYYIKAKEYTNALEVVSNIYLKIRIKGE